tara:strand:- start:6 stop:839 length:834 start_codon:yes stop_codon:yes gene_type:complete
MPIYVKKSGSWVSPRVYIKSSSIWKEPNQIYVKDAGIWKPIYTVVNITSSTQNVNLYTLAGNPTEPVTIIVNISDGVTIGSSSSTPALTSGSLNASSVLHLNVGTGAYVVGKGGTGGNRVSGSSGAGNVKPGTVGSLAFYTRIQTYLTNNGTIAGGGGGGGGGGVTNASGQAYDDYTGAGGGGAGNTVGSGGTGAGPASNSGTLTTGGAGIIYYSNPGSGEIQYGSSGGTGGNLGLAGANGAPYQTLNAGGAAGNAIDGSSYTTILTAGSILGGQVN